MKARAIDYGFAALLTVLGLLYLQFVYRPAVRDADRMAGEIRSANAEICRSEDFTRGLEDLERYLEEFEESIVALDRLVPEAVDGDQRLRDIDRIVRGLELKTRSIRPDPGRREGPVVAHPLTIEVSGTWDRILAFVDAAEGLPQLTRATVIEVEEDSDAPGFLRAQVELTSFSLAEPDESGGAGS